MMGEDEAELGNPGPLVHHCEQGGVHRAERERADMGERPRSALCTRSMSEIARSMSPRGHEAIAR